MRQLASVFLALLSGRMFGAEPIVVDLWPDKPPGFQIEDGSERDTSSSDSNLIAGRPVIRLGNVSIPRLHIYKPPAGRQNGTAVVICPGGGFHILAWDLEGTEVAEWLTSNGVTAAVLKYRVPTAKHDQNWLPPAQDAQRAVRLIRSRAAEWGVDVTKVGLLGFSAGGRTAVMASAHADERLYEPMDAADELSARPDFLVLAYPGYLAAEDGTLRNDIPVSRKSPPAFLVHAFDDPVSPKSSIAYFLALKDVDVPAELHLYASGGHGYGLRPTEQPVTSWPDRCAEWMQSRGLLERVTDDLQAD